MRKVIATLVMVLIIASIAMSANTYSVKFYKKLVKTEKIGRIRQYYSDRLNDNILKNRGDDIIIEKVIGVVVDKKRNGRVISGDGYISYKRVNGAKKGDVIFTLFIYAPGNSCIDDIVDRFDYIIDRTEKG